MSLKTGRMIPLVGAVVLGVAWLTGCAARDKASGWSLAWDFEDTSPGGLPSGWSQQAWGEGKTHWEVLETDSGHVLAQVASGNPNRHFNLVVYDPLRVRNVTLKVRLRAAGGLQDQGGGFVWRYQDERNHYIVRANPLENNVVAYKMEDGIRTDLPRVGLGRSYGVQTDLPGTEWLTLQVDVMNEAFVVRLDGRELFRVVDDTHSGPGKVGLWTKADAVTWFDDFSVRVRAGS